MVMHLKYLYPDSGWPVSSAQASVKTIVGANRNTDLIIINIYLKEDVVINQFNYYCHRYGFRVSSDSKLLIINTKTSLSETLMMVKVFTK